MSVILDALKKLEREKASRRSGPVDIVPEITIPSARREKSAKWKLASVVTGAVILTAVATTLVITPFTSRDRKAAPVASAITSMPQDETSAPAASAPPVPAITENRPAPVPETMNRASAELDRPMPRDENPTGEQALVSPARARRSRETATVDTAAPASITVSGIAWQDDRADRRAVVNGALVGEGATAGGARIVRIYRDKVRFSIDGRTFDVPLSGQSQGKLPN